MKKRVSSSTWQNQFQKQLEGWTPLTGDYSVANAISDGRLDEDEYLLWAQKQFGRAAVQGAFFTNHPPTKKLLEKSAHPELPWGPTFLPLGIWDGVTLVAGIEVPSDLPEGWSFVLAKASDLERCWSALQDNTEEAEDEDEISAGVLEQPEGFSGDANIAPPKLSFKNLGLQKEAPAAPKTIPPAKTSPEPIPVISLTTPSDEEPVLTFANIIEKPPVPPAQAEPIAATHSVVHSAQQTSTQGHAPRQGTVSAMTSPTIKKAAPSSNRHLLVSVAKRPKYPEQVQTVLTQMTAYFQKSMVLGLTEAGDAFIPSEWTDLFLAPSQNNPLSTREPGVFSIIKDTEKPFHGTPVPSEANDLFFQMWNDSQTPAHLSIVPIFFMGRIVGAFLGFAEKQQDLESLRALEKLSLSFTKNLGGVLEDIAA